MENSIPEGKSRLGWFDAMRGLAMVLVVFMHVMHYGLGVDAYDSVLTSVIAAFYLPLFFFISGFFAYRAYECWTPALVGDIMKRRVQALIIGPRIFATLTLFCASGDFVSSLYGSLSFGSSKWFTTALLEMFVVFLALSLLSKLFKSERILEVGLILISIVGVAVLAATPPGLRGGDSTLWTVICMENFCKYFQFFTLGIFCRKYRGLFESLLSKNWFKAGITICAIVCLVLYYHDGFRNFNALLYGFVHDIAIRYAMLLLVVAFFFAKREFFEATNATSSVLRYVGRRTLDIYLIHSLFFPDLSILTEWIAPNSMFILQLTIGLAVSLAIVAVCLLLSEVLRMSDFLSAWLFGVKIKRQ